MYRAPLVPADFEVPSTLEADGFRLQPLTYELMLEDYEAVIAGAKNLGIAFDDPSFDPKAYTLQREVVELGWHMGEWRRRKSFAYANMSPDCATCYGSVYVHPTMKRDYDAHVITWVRPETPEGFDEHVYRIVREWMKGWPFERVGYPGREMSWKDWHALPEPEA